MHELAGELLRLYAVRQTRTRAAYEDEEGWLERLERAFPYTETEDQVRAIDEVYEDLTGEQPMDRLICGDVGFGKTEVAMRAAFLVAISGRQVLVLAPTTLLVQQHLQTFRDRFRDFPVRVEAVSRMREAGDVKQALRAFSEGKIEVLIGTHRLLSRDVIPQKLGLIVVDEEQRFGVRQKELLRQLRLEVDALSMSATPIPRTLHMSLAGLRDISVIATPPRGRQPIRTHVTEYDETLVAAAIRREIAREGQVFYLHNRVETIHEAAEKIRRLVPEARVGVGHGQMDDRRWSRRWSSSCAATSTCSSRPRSSRAGSTSRRSTRSSSSAPTCSGWRSCTRSAVASAVARTPRTPTSCTPTGASSPRRRARALRRWPTTRSSARATASRCAISSCAAPAACSATSSPATSRRSASSSTATCSPRPSPS